MTPVLRQVGAGTVRIVSAVGRRDATGEADGRPGVPAGPDVEVLLPIIRRVIRARVPDHALAEDLVQETLVRVLAAAQRIQPQMFEPYAIATARNLVASTWKQQDRERRNQHRVIDFAAVETPDETLLAGEERMAVARALDQLTERDRRILLDHEIAGRGTMALAEDIGSTPGAVAAQLNRTRARLRVEYLLALESATPPTELCRPVLLALSGGDRRRQREVDVSKHLLECDLCARLSAPLVDRGRRRDDDDQLRLPIRADADIVAARRAARELATRLGFPRTALTVIATAVSEVARNIVRFAGTGEIQVQLVRRPRPGLHVVARDAGPGIPDVEQALADGYSTYNGLGLGLPGARRLMDEFAVVSAPGGGTTVTMTKWLQES